MNKKFTLITSDREPKPRSKRLRELGGGSTSSGTAGGATVVNVSGGNAAPDPNSHTHANKADLDKLSTDNDGYGYISQMREVEETDDDGNKTTNWANAKDKIKAGYADVAKDLSEDSPIREMFLSRLVDDVAKGNITFEQAIEVLGLASFAGGVSLGDGTYAIDKYGVARLAGLVAAYLRSKDFSKGTAQGLDGTGYGVTEDNGRYTMEIDNLIVRMKMVIAALDVHEMTYVGGSVVLSPCGNRVDMVRACNAAGEEITDQTEDQAVSCYRCYFLANDGEREVKNKWSVGQLARCKTENMVDGETVTNQDYWRLCTGVDAEAVEIGGKRYHYIDLSNNAETGMTFTVAEGGETKTYTLDDLPGVDGTLNSVPQAGDNVVGLGHAWYKRRQNAAMISAGDNIGWTLYKGIDRYALDERYVVNRFSVDETVVTTDHLVMRPYAQPDDTTTVTCMRGAYDAAKVYGHNDLVTYGGQVWICTVKLGDTVQGKEPSLTGEGKDYWAVYVAKGEDGKDGKSARRTAVVQLTSDKGTIFDKEYQDVVLKCKVWIDGKSMGGRIHRGNFNWSKDGKSNVSETEFRYRTVSSTDAINRWECNVAIPRRLIEPIELTAVAVDGNHLIVRASEDITGMYMYPCWRARYCTRMNEGFENATRWRFHDLVHGDFGRYRIKALPMQPLGGNLYQVDMSAVLTFVETRCIVLHKTVKVTTRKTALKHGTHTYWAKRGDDGKYRAWGRYGVMLAINGPRDTMAPISTVAKCKVYITTDSDTATTGTASLSI